jgi:timeless
MTSTIGVTDRRALAAAQSSPPPRSSAASRRVTPPRDALSVEPSVVDELLLVCGVIGTTVSDTDTPDRIVPVADCLNWLQDLQRALRRDDDQYRPISLLMAQWKIVPQKLLPLVDSCRYDTDLVLTVAKILVILTKPLAESTERAGKLPIETKTKTTEAVIREQIRLRENALQQAEARMEYKRAICHYHHGHTHDSNPTKSGGGILSIFVSLLAEPLSKSGTARTEADHLKIELVLHLFRNLLSAEPLLHSSAAAVAQAQTLHDDCVVLLDQELVLEILLVLGADIEQRENLQYNLLLMELVHHLLRHYDPAVVARAVPSPTGAAAALPPKPRPGLLSQSLQREKQKFHAPIMSRHAHFGGTLVVKQAHNPTQQQYVSTAALGPGHRSAPLASKRKTKKSEPFIGSKSHPSHHTRTAATLTPSRQKAVAVLQTFCQRWVQDCYGPVTKSLKHEFRRDSVRLEESDRVTFFRMVWFFARWWRLSPAAVRSRQVQQDDTVSNQSAVGQLIFTMDVFAFNLVLNATDTFQQHKKYARLAQTVALLGEMMHLLTAMYSSQESTEQIMAMGLMDRLFYGSEPLDRLPKLLSSWQPGSSTRDYLCDLVEVVHVQLKLLDTHAQACRNVDTSQAKHDTVAKMKLAAADFDTTHYLTRRIISNHVVYMYTQLLTQYDVNAAHVNHRIVAFLLRLTKLQIAGTVEPEDVVLPAQKLLTAPNVTLQPMLYNFQVLRVFQTILNDKSIRRDKDYVTLLAFAAGIVHDFAQAAERNPVLFVEALFKHPVPHRFCEYSANLYVTEELRMIAERELLLEEQRKFEEQVAAVRDDDDSEDELEFEDLEVESKVATKTVSLGGKRKVLYDSDSDEGETDPAPSLPAGTTSSREVETGDSEDSSDDDEKIRESLEQEHSSILGDFAKTGVVDPDHSSDEEEFDRWVEEPPLKKKRSVDEDDQ